MTRFGKTVLAATAALALLAGAGTLTVANAHGPNYGYGAGGYGPMGRGMMGQGMMGYGGPGHMWGTEREFNADQIKTLWDARLLMHGDPLKVGTVTETDKGTFQVELLDENGTPVRTYEVNKNTTFPVR